MWMDMDVDMLILPMPLKIANLCKTRKSFKALDTTEE